MSNSSATTAAEIMDRSAVLMNDPSKTDYKYDVLMPFLRMAIDELTQTMVDGQSSPVVQTSSIIILPKGMTALYHIDSLNVPAYPSNLIEIQQIAERTAGTQDSFTPMKRTEFVRTFEASDRLMYWAWENEIIKFNPKGATVNIELQLQYIKDFSVSGIQPETFVASVGSRSYLAYKTAAYAAMYVGENPERAKVLDAQAERALERIESINNKGRQQIMTRHRPFRASWKARGGY